MIFAARPNPAYIFSNSNCRVFIFPPKYVDVTGPAGLDRLEDVGGGDARKTLAALFNFPVAKFFISCTLPLCPT